MTNAACGPYMNECSASPTTTPRISRGIEPPLIDGKNTNGHPAAPTAARPSAEPVLLSGTVAMLPGVDQFAGRWRVEMSDPVTGRTLELGYAVERMPEPIG